MFMTLDIIFVRSAKITFQYMLAICRGSPDTEVILSIWDKGVYHAFLMQDDARSSKDDCPGKAFGTSTSLCLAWLDWL